MQVSPAGCEVGARGRSSFDRRGRRSAAACASRGRFRNGAGSRFVAAGLPHAWPRAGGGDATPTGTTRTAGRPLRRAVSAIATPEIAVDRMVNWACASSRRPVGEKSCSSRLESPEVRVPTCTMKLVVPRLSTTFMAVEEVRFGPETAKMTWSGRPRARGDGDREPRRRRGHGHGAARRQAELRAERVHHGEGRRQVRLTEIGIHPCRLGQQDRVVEVVDHGRVARDDRKRAPRAGRVSRQHLAGR